MRPSWDEYFFDLAQRASTRATCPRASIGCVIVDARTHQIVSTGYNGAAAGEPHCEDVGCEILANHCIRARHAEVNAAEQIGDRVYMLNGALRVVRTDGNLIAYVVGGREVCSHCARALHAAGVREVHWREAVPSLEEVLREVVEWGKQQFPFSTDRSRIAHLREEVDELEAEPESAEEGVDVLMLLAHQLEAHGNLVDLAKNLATKLAVCRTRTWGEPDADGKIKAVKGVPWTTQVEIGMSVLPPTAPPATSNPETERVDSSGSPA